MIPEAAGHSDVQPSRPPASRKLSIVTPAFNEADNLPVFHERLRQALAPLDLDWEWIVVDDHSADGTFAVLKRISAADPRVRGIRLARNSGSHLALTCGFHEARGDGAVAMAADLQDPPEVLDRLVARWQDGAQIVWAAREGREGERATTVLFSKLYYWIMRRVVGMTDIPAGGADFFLVDRCVLDAFTKFEESHVSIFGLFTWMGYRQETIHYVKEARQQGRSGWTIEKKLKLLVDSLTAFTYLPIRFISYTGVLFAFLGFLYALVVLFNFILQEPVEGWSSLMVVVLIMGGMQMLMLGVLGEYIWRTLYESRRRPLYLIEGRTSDEPAPADR